MKRGFVWFNQTVHIYKCLPCSSMNSFVYLSSDILAFNSFITNIENVYGKGIMQSKCLLKQVR